MCGNDLKIPFSIANQGQFHEEMTKYVKKILTSIFFEKIGKVLLKDLPEIRQGFVANLDMEFEIGNRR